MKNKIKNIFEEYKVLMRSVPGLVTASFFLALICMNLLANKTIWTTAHTAADGGILIGWATFLAMDIITIRFGPRASTMVSISAAVANAFIAILFKIAAIIPTAEDFSAFNMIVGGTWFITISSITAQIVSAFANNFSNYAIGKLFKKKDGEGEGKLEYVCRSYISTFIGQFVDNFVFGTLAFIVFAPYFWDGFHWTLPQSLFCAFMGAIIELISQIIFSPIGYRIVKKWEKENVGIEYREKYLLAK